MDAAHEMRRRPLGAVLVAQGLLTEEQLVFALREQARVGKPLGHVLVDLGLASAPALASALAEQEGRLHRSEFGVSVGFRRDLARDDTPDLPPVGGAGATPAPTLQAVPDPDASAPGGVDPVPALLRALAEREAELEELRARPAPPPAGRVYEAGRHRLLVPTGSGYALVERDGPPPVPGERVAVELPGREPCDLVVAKVAPSVPGSPLACVFLTAP